ncbi:GntR family transcriptional regulator [Inquilinus limosus]|uniref:GntR family transcriptional regulator n=1 Tax=Inquilinus limosus TaxID=171674 RepID=UPI003F15D99E
MAGKRALRRSGTIVDEMVRAIADRIVMGQAPPGEKLDEATLAKRFEVSRTPVREALRQLVAMGLVDRRPNCGATVATMSPDHLASVFEAMAELEGICARLCAIRMTAGERRALERAHLDSARLVRLGAEEDYELHNTEFHSRLYQGAHSSHIQELATTTRSRLGPFRRAQFRVSGRLTKSWTEHDVIVTGILRGDASAAEAAARAHVSIVGEVSAAFVSGDGPSRGEPLVAAQASSI